MGADDAAGPIGQQQPTGAFNRDNFALEFAFWQGPHVTSAGGLDELQRAAADFRDVFDEFYFRHKQFIKQGESIFVIGSMGSRAQGSGALIDQSAVHEWKMRDGKATQLCAYTPTVRRARVAAGAPAELDAPTR